MRWRPDIVRSLGWDPGHHEEIWNSPENKIHIREVIFRVSEKFGNFPCPTGGFLEGSRGATCGPNDPGETE